VQQSRLKKSSKLKPIILMMLLLFLVEQSNERINSMSQGSNEKINALPVAIEAYVQRKVATDPKLPAGQNKSLQDEERREMCHAFAELVDSRIEGRLTDELWESWDEMQREQMEHNRQNLSFMNSLIKLIDKLKQQSV
jgi:hypothetical protein